MIMMGWYKSCLIVTKVVCIQIFWFILFLLLIDHQTCWFLTQTGNKEIKWKNLYYSWCSRQQPQGYLRSPIIIKKQCTTKHTNTMCISTRKRLAGVQTLIRVQNLEFANHYKIENYSRYCSIVVDTVVGDFRFLSLYLI